MEPANVYCRRIGQPSPMKLQKQGKADSSEEQPGYDMEKLIGKFPGNELFCNMTS